MKGARDMPQLRTRIPEWLKAALDNSSKENDRSLNAEVVRRLRESFENKEK